MGLPKVSLQLAERKIRGDGKVSLAYELLESDSETQLCLQVANVMAVKRLYYNDHGPVHSRIVAGTALEIFDILKESAKPTIVRDGVGDESDAKLVTFCGAYLHDIGNSIHRDAHHISGCIVATPILTRTLSRIYGDKSEQAVRIRQEILQSIFSHDDDVRCLSVEAGVSKIADGCDMAEGRARIPYRLGKVDIHSLSALSITEVEVEPGLEKPLRIIVHMNSSAGVFQVEEVLMKKIETSSLLNETEILALDSGKEIKRI